MKMGSNIVLVFAALCANSPVFAGDNERVVIEGGISSKQLADLWKIAKLECLDMGYKIANEDKDIQTIFCSREVEMGTNSVRVTFYDNGFVVETQGVAQGIPLLGNLHKKNKRKMTQALMSGLR